MFPKKSLIDKNSLYACCILLFFIIDNTNISLFLKKTLFIVPSTFSTLSQLNFCATPIYSTPPPSPSLPRPTPPHPPTSPFQSQSDLFPLPYLLRHLLSLPDPVAISPPSPPTKLIQGMEILYDIWQNIQLAGQLFQRIFVCYNV